MIRASGGGRKQVTGPMEPDYLPVWTKAQCTGLPAVRTKNQSVRRFKPPKTDILKGKNKQVLVYLCCGWSFSTMCLHEYESFTVCA